MVSRQVVAFSEACSVQQAALLLVINYQITEAEKMAKRIYLGQALVHMARRMNTGGQLGAILDARSVQIVKVTHNERIIRHKNKHLVSFIVFSLQKQP